MSTHEPQALDWSHQVQEELRKVKPADWTICIYAYRYGQSAGADQLKPVPGSFVGDEVDKIKSVVAKVAEIAASFHFTVIVNPNVANLDLESTALGSDAKKSSIYAVPVFRPDMYDPSPIMRPLLGVACFASDLSTEQVIRNTDLHSFAGRFAGIAENQITDDKKVSWDEIREDTLARLAPQQLTPMKPLNQTRDSSGSVWWEFRVGCFAREDDIKKLRWFQERFFVADRKDRWISPTQISAVKPIESSDIKRYIDAGDFVGLYKEIDVLADAQLRGFMYREIATVCMERNDAFNSVIAANKRQEVLGQTPEAYAFLGYVYWWFENIDIAISHSENALELALNLPDIERTKDIAYDIKNNLAFYYAEAEKQDKKDLAFSYVTENLARLSPDDEVYWRRLDTAGYVYAKYADKAEDIDIAIKYLLASLELEPQSKDTQQHLIQALEKKKSLKQRIGKRE